MSDRWLAVTVTMVGTFVSALIASGKLPSQMAATGWADSLTPPILQSILMGLGALGYQAPPVRRFLGRP